MDKTTYDKINLIFNQENETLSNIQNQILELFEVSDKKTRVICSKEDWIRMDREEAARKECELNKDRPLFDTELKINLFRIGGFKNES